MDKNVLKSGQKTQIFDQTWISIKYFSQIYPNFSVPARFYFFQKWAENDQK
jgi:hypothetical protein